MVGAGGGGLSAGEDRQDGKRSNSHHMINTVSYLPELDPAVYCNKVSTETLSSRVTQRQVLTRFPNNTRHLKATTKDLQRCLTELHNAELRPGVFVVFVSIQ